MPAPQSAPRPAPTGNPLAAASGGMPDPDNREGMNKFIGQQQAQSAYRQQVFQQQTAQANSYFKVMNEPMEAAKKAGDTKLLRKYMQQAVEENPGNQVVAQRTKQITTMMDNGWVPGPGSTSTIDLNIPPSDSPQYRGIADQLAPYMPEGTQPTPDSVVRISMDGKRITSVDDTVSNIAGGKTKTPEQIAEGVLREKLHRRPTMTEVADYIKAEKEDIADHSKATTNMYVTQRDEKKEALKEKAADAKKSPDEDMLPMVADYLVSHKLPGNMRDPATQAQFRRVANAQLKYYGISPMEWAKMGPNSQAGQKALNKIATINAQVQRDEETAKKLLVNVVTQGKAIKSSMSGFKKADDWLNHLRAEYKGNPKAVNINNTIYEALVDYGKVMGGNVGAGGLTDSARKEAQMLLTAGMAGGDGVQEIVDNMIANMAVRTTSNKQISEGINASISDAFKSGEKKPLASY
jgi:hypothetical protein